MISYGTGNQQHAIVAFFIKTQKPSQRIIIYGNFVPPFIKKHNNEPGHRFR